MCDLNYKLKKKSLHSLKDSRNTRSNVFICFYFYFHDLVFSYIKIYF